MCCFDISLWRVKQFLTLFSQLQPPAMSNRLWSNYKIKIKHNSKQQVSLIFIFWVQKGKLFCASVIPIIIHSERWIFPVPSKKCQMILKRFVGLWTFFSPPQTRYHDLRPELHTIHKRTHWFDWLVGSAFIHLDLLSRTWSRLSYCDDLLR